MNSSIETYIQKKGWAGKIVKEKSGRQLICDCPLCGEKQKGDNRPFYMSLETGKWNTWCCSRKGNLITLQRELGDYTPKSLTRMGGTSVQNRIKLARSAAAQGVPAGRKGHVPTLADVARWHDQLLVYPHALAYVTDTRGLSLDAIRHFKLGALRKDGYDWLAIPTIVDDELCMLKFRNLDPTAPPKMKWRRFAGMRSVMFGAQDVMEACNDEVYVSEAELDAIAAWDLGLRPSCASSLGAGNFPEDWREILMPFQRVYVLYDQLDKPSAEDKQAGDAGAEQAARALGTFRSYRTVFPAHDVNDWLLSRPTTSDVMATIEVSIPYNVCNIESIYDASVRLSDVVVSKAKSTGYGVLDTLLGGGIRDGEITMLMADTSIGKTTFSTDFGRRFARAGGGGVLYWPIEGGPVGVSQKIWCQELGDVWRTVKRDDPAKFDAMLESLKTLEFYLYATGSQPMEEFKSVLSHFARMGGKLVIIDHFHHLIRPEVKTQMDQVVVIERWLTFLCEVAKEFNIHVWFVAHPKEPQVRRDAANDSKADVSFEPDLHHFRGASAGKQDVDNVVVLTRKRTKGRDSEEERADIVPTKLITKKVRSDDGYEGNGILYFHKKSQRYLTVDADGKVADKKDPTQSRYEKQDADDDVDDWFKDPQQSASVH